MPAGGTCLCRELSHQVCKFAMCVCVCVCVVPQEMGEDWLRYVDWAFCAVHQNWPRPKQTKLNCMQQSQNGYNELKTVRERETEKLYSDLA